MSSETSLIHVSDGVSHALVADPNAGSVEAPLIEISMQGALLKTTMELDANAYIDVKLVLKGLAEHQLFAHVVSSGEAGLRLRWVFFDPGDEGRFRTLLEHHRAASTGASQAAPGEVSAFRQAVTPESASVPSSSTSTRRVVRPKTTSITPFSDSPASRPAANPREEKPAVDRVGTRRVLRAQPPAKPTIPNDQAITPFGGSQITPFELTEPGETTPRGVPTIPPSAATPNRTKAAPPASDDHQPHAAQPAGPGEESRTHHVVIQPTDQFVKMVDLEKPAGTPHVEDQTRMVRRDDGRMDIGASIRTHAKTIRASELAARHERVRVLNMATIKSLIQEAVEEAAKHLTSAMGEAERKRLLEEAEESFQEKLKAFQLEKASADEKATKLANQLSTAQRLLEEERKRSISADQFTVSSAGLAEIEASFNKLIDRSVVDGKLSGSLEEQMRTLASRVLDEERQRIREKEMQAQNDKIDLLEKKIKRLAGNLEETERQRDEAREIAGALEKMAGQGMSVDQIKQKFQIGLQKDDPDRERKMLVMREVLEQNRELRRKLGLSFNDGAGDKPAAPAIVAAEPTPSVPAAIIEEPVAADEAAAAGEPGESAEPLVNPDDEPWSPDAAPLVNPDDEPWSPPGSATEGGESDDRGVKILRDYKKFEPPPLKR